MPTINVFSKNKKNIFFFFHLKIIIFTAVKNCNVLNGHVFVMVRCPGFSLLGFPK